MKRVIRGQPVSREKHEQAKVLRRRIDTCQAVTLADAAPKRILSNKVCK